MTEKREAEMISRRRAFSILGLAALSVAMSPTVLTVSDAEAQTGTTTTPRTGTERRQERRGERTERRQERRTARTERRQERRAARTERRTERTTGQAERRQQPRGTTPTRPRTPGDDD